MTIKNLRCIPIDTGTQVALSPDAFFIFSDATHVITDLGNNRVRVTRKLNPAYHEVYNEPVTEFTDDQEQSVASTVAELHAYLSRQGFKVKAGEGVSVGVDNTVSVVAGGPDTVGGYKVGNGLQVDGSGKLSATATSEVTKVLSNESEMLALQVESLRSYRVIRLDTKKLYYLNSGVSPSVLSNWFVGPSIDAVAVSFNTRTGAVVPEFGDYDLSLVPVKDSVTNTQHKFVVEDGVLYLQNTTTNDKVKVAYGSDTTQLSIDLTNLDNVVRGSNGLVSKVSSLEALTAANNADINNATTGILKRLSVVEAGTGVVSFNGRKGAVVIQNGDVTTTQITETEARSFVSNEERANWNSGLITSSQKNKLDSLLTTYQNDLRYIPAGQKGVQGGVATLDSFGKVTTSQLPDIGGALKVTVANTAARLALPSHSDLMIAYEQDTQNAYAINKNESPSIPSNWTPVGSLAAMGVSSFKGRNGAIVPATGDYTADLISETASRTFVTTADRTALTPRIWRNRQSTERVANTQYTNSSGRELDIYVESSISDGGTLYLDIKAPADASYMRFYATTVTGALNSGTVGWNCLSMSVPNGWQYLVGTSEGKTIAVWHELN